MLIAAIGGAHGDICALDTALSRIDDLGVHTVLCTGNLAAGSVDGNAVIERLREEAGCMLPALLITADVSSDLQERCTRSHVTLLGKPLLPARLRQALAIMLPDDAKVARTSNAVS